MMQLEVLPEEFAVCRLKHAGGVDWGADFTFVAKTDEELSLVCPAGSLPEAAQETKRGWRALRVCGQLDFSLTGIIARISAVIARAGLAIFVVSTFNTDYVLVDGARLEVALAALREDGYTIV